MRLDIAVIDISVCVGYNCIYPRRSIWVIPIWSLFLFTDYYKHRFYSASLLFILNSAYFKFFFDFYVNSSLKKSAILTSEIYFLRKQSVDFYGFYCHSVTLCINLNLQFLRVYDFYFVGFYFVPKKFPKICSRLESLHFKFWFSVWSCKCSVLEDLFLKFWFFGKCSI